MYDKYDIITNERRFGENIPFYIVTEKYIEYETVETDLNSELETIRLKKALSDTISAGLKDGKIIAAKYKDMSEGNMQSVKIYCECVEDIGVTVKHEQK
jgi:hypothetical protein